MKKNLYIEFFLCFFFGFFGAHKFYLKKHKIGVLYLFTLGFFGVGWLIDCIIIWTKIFKNYNSNKINPYNEIIYIDNLSDGWQFEHYTANLLKKLGYSNVKVTSGSGDYGVDILASKSGIKYAIQCKLYSNPVSNKAVQEIYSGKDFYKCDVAVVITNSTFTKAAIQLANSLNVILIDRTELISLLKQINKNNRIQSSLKNIKEESNNTNSSLRNIQEELKDINTKKEMIKHQISKINLPFDYDEEDLLLDAISYAFARERISTGMLQRLLRIGFNRASAIIAQMIDLGILSNECNSPIYFLNITLEEFLIKYQKSTE
ncbi:restriction endonuclease [Clostridium nigeriense]|uniref:restriction endonuclease n=1 Tax=Clostridium nigeriense TaxID=1805470 RepID=UPI003D332C96